MPKLLLVFSSFLFLPSIQAQFQFTFDDSTSRWSLSNGVVKATFRLNESNNFVFEQIAHLGNGNTWRATGGDPVSPIHFTLDGSTYNGSSQFTLLDQSTNCADPGRCEQIIILQDSVGPTRIQVHLEMYPKQPVLRHWISVINLRARPIYVQAADLLPYSFDDESRAYRLFRVNQWQVVPDPENFETGEFALDPAGDGIPIESGAHGQHCGWLALRDENDRGVFAGWEFDGKTSASVQQIASSNSLQLAAPIASMNHPMAPGETFNMPRAFIGLFQGDWDEGAYRTQQFTNAVLAKPLPDTKNFPYLVWDSWGYALDLNEENLKREADLAAQNGVELFVIDLGWSKQLGNWYADPRKFPSGLIALSDYVHSQGMKFGLHFAFAEISAEAPILQEHASWLSSDNNDYFDSVSLCLSNQPTQDWIVAQAVRIIDDYNVDWILQDGENMVKTCTKKNHTHDPADSNYSNAVNGVNAVLARVQKLRPNVLWENCENGGNMMTFNMVRYYATSITNDASGAEGSREAVYGATYPFPTRYTDRYQPEDFTSSYVTRSYLFGGPWHLMNRLAAQTPDQLTLASTEFGIYKALRGPIARGKVFHLTPSPAVVKIDAIESYDASTDSAVAVVTRNGGDDDSIVIQLRGLNFQQTYRVHFQDDTRVLAMTGEQLASEGVQVKLANAQSSEIVYADPMQ